MPYDHRRHSRIAKSQVLRFGLIASHSNTTHHDLDEACVLLMNLALTNKVSKASNLTCPVVGLKLARGK
uniref:Uncharacterized protein n=1 Tax=Cannabis sativa TaxID=3483 RepID=A0A803QRE4_CANSA